MQCCFQMCPLSLVWVSILRLPSCMGRWGFDRIPICNGPCLSVACRMIPCWSLPWCYSHGLELSCFTSSPKCLCSCFTPVVLSGVVQKTSQDTPVASSPVRNLLPLECEMLHVNVRNLNVNVFSPFSAFLRSCISRFPLASAEGILLHFHIELSFSGFFFTLHFFPSSFHKCCHFVVYRQGS